MQRSALAGFNTRFSPGASPWLTRRWYYSTTHRAYSVRQISPGDRRLLAEFALGLSRTATDREIMAIHDLTDMLFDRVISASVHNAAGFVALESTAVGDRVIGVCAYSTTTHRDDAEFVMAVAATHREEQIGRTLLATLLRHAKRVGIPRLSGEMHWSNRPMQMLGLSLGFQVEPVTSDRNLRRLVLALK